MPKKSGSGISRRDFIKTTGAGALTAGLGPFFLFPERAQGVGEAAVQELKKQLRGELLRPGDGGCDAARRVWNGMVDKRPALIVRCAGVADAIQGTLSFQLLHVSHLRAIEIGSMRALLESAQWAPRARAPQNSEHAVHVGGREVRGEMHGQGMPSG